LVVSVKFLVNVFFLKTFFCGAKALIPFCENYESLSETRDVKLPKHGLFSNTLFDCLTFILASGGELKLVLVVFIFDLLSFFELKSKILVKRTGLSISEILKILLFSDSSVSLIFGSYELHLLKFEDFKPSSLNFSEKSSELTLSKLEGKLKLSDSSVAFMLVRLS